MEIDKIEKRFPDAHPTFKERMRTLEKRGIDIDRLLTDWCVTCKFSNRIDGWGDCGTGCNGMPPFTLDEDGRRVFAKTDVPLKYEREPFTEDVVF